MSQINNVSGTNPVQQLVNNPIQKQVPANAPTQMRATDRLELSGSSHLLKALQSNDIRTDKVANIKAQIEAGTYDADGSKLDAATGKVLDEISK